MFRIVAYTKRNNMLAVLLMIFLLFPNVLYASGKEKGKKETSNIPVSSSVSHTSSTLVITSSKKQDKKTASRGLA